MELKWQEEGKWQLMDGIESEEMMTRCTDYRDIVLAKDSERRDGGRENKGGGMRVAGDV